MNILIVGAGPGISYSIAKRFGGAGFRVALVARNPYKLNKLVDELAAMGIDAISASADVAQPDSLRAAIEVIHDQMGHPDVIVFNPSGFAMKEILDQDWETIRWATDVSAGGLFHLMKMMLPYCLEHNRGKILVTGGGTALQGVADMAALSVGKAAMRNLVQAFQERVQGTNIHIAQVTVCGHVRPDSEKYNPDLIAEIFWGLYRQEPGEYEMEVIY
jgi:NADP-dependent 3-hydroxy acid dehydrogenase YdfG